jgi:xylan 1,4-beta-xylosidase
LRKTIAGLAVLLALLCALAAAQDTQTATTVVIDAAAPAQPFPHFWEKVFGSGRAILALREGYREDLRATKKITGFEYVRFHAIFHDEVGIYNEDAQGKPFYNFSYADQIYDGLLKDGVRPFVELSFMPRKLAAFESPHAFWYKQNVAPPKDYKLWDDMITAFAKHLIERYGEDEVAKWYFEVWNEPNIDFWTGNPKEQTYYELYDHTAQALKAVSSRLRVGGPATAQAAWADRFIAHCAEKNVPVDFVSTHVYGNDSAKDVFGTNETIPREEMVCRAVRKVRDQIKASAKPNLPLIWSEFNASYANEPAVTDSVYMGPWMANTIRECDGLVDMMSYWTFSDVFEEQGVIKTPFYGGFGLLAEGGVPKPAFNAMKILHLLGDKRVASDGDSTLITRRADGATVVAVWNLGTLDKPGPERSFKLQLKTGKGRARATIYRVDTTHGDPHAAYEQMGSPASPTAKQYQTLKQAGTLPAPETRSMANGALEIVVPYHGLAVIEIK